MFVIGEVNLNWIMQEESISNILHWCSSGTKPNTQGNNTWVKYLVNAVWKIIFTTDWNKHYRIAAEEVGWNRFTIPHNNQNVFKNQLLQYS